MGEQPLSLCALAGVVGRGGDVDQQARAGLRLLARGRARPPQVLAHRQSDAPAGDVDRRSCGARREVAALVEHAVVGEMELAIDVPDGAISQHGRGVVDVTVRQFGKPDDRGDARAGDLARQILQRRASVREEVLAQEQVLRGVAGERKLSEQHEFGARGARRTQAVEDAACVAGDVADGGVDLAEGKAQRQGIVSALRAGSPRPVVQPLSRCVRPCPRGSCAERACRVRASRWPRPFSPRRPSLETCPAAAHPRRGPARRSPGRGRARSTRARGRRHSRRAGRTRAGRHSSSPRSPAPGGGRGARRDTARAGGARADTAGTAGRERS